MIRPARPEDVAVLVQLVGDLAEYERAPDQVQLTSELLAESLFGADPKAFALVAEQQGGIEGMAIWFVNYSTWTGRHGIYLEDLFVRPDARGSGTGRALLAELARIAVNAGYARINWSVLEWNEPAIGFYRRLGAAPQEEWVAYRLEGPALIELAGGASPPPGPSASG